MRPERARTAEPGDRPHPDPHGGYKSGSRVWLVRHGEVHADWLDVAYGDLDAPLSAGGEAQTRVLGERFGALRPSVVAASSLARARRLGEAIAAAAQSPLTVEDGLRERFRGTAQGRRRSELEREGSDEARAPDGDPWSSRAHGAESDQALCARAWPVLEQCVSRGAGGTVVLATHYGVIRVLLARALGVPPAASFGLRVDKGAAALLVDGAEGWMLVHLNVQDPRGAAPEGTVLLDGMHLAEPASEAP